MQNEYINASAAGSIAYLVCERAAGGHEDQALYQLGPFVAGRGPIYPEYPGASTRRTLVYHAEAFSDSYPVRSSRLALGSLPWFSLERLQYPV
jgi:hypothetical protein